jgi:spore photoproduct lyase
MDGLLDIVGKWFAYAKGHPDVTIELRTKAANLSAIEKLQPADNVILAWTLSPERIIASYEHGTPSLKQRLACIGKALEKGFLVRLCFDPMIYCSDWKCQYEELIDSVFSVIPVEHISDTSIGTFRISCEYMKQIRKQRPDSALIQYPFEIYNGIYGYRRELSKEMITFAYNLVRERMPEDKIFVWEDKLLLRQ